MTVQHYRSCAGGSGQGAAIGERSAVGDSGCHSRGALGGICQRGVGRDVVADVRVHDGGVCPGPAERVVAANALAFLSRVEQTHSQPVQAGAD